MANFEAFRGFISSSINLLFLKSEVEVEKLGVQNQNRIKIYAVVVYAIFKSKYTEIIIIIPLYYVKKFKTKLSEQTFNNFLIMKRKGGVNYAQNTNAIVSQSAQLYNDKCIDVQYTHY